MGRLYIPFPSIYNWVDYIYHFLVYITGSVALNVVDKCHFLHLMI